MAVSVSPGSPALPCYCPTLPQTGSGDGTLALLRYGLVLVVAGGLVVLAVRRRRHAPA